MSLDGLVAIVTGGSRGLGREIVDALAARGARVVACATAAWQADHANIECVVADVGDDEACARLVERTAKRHGRLDALINNAAIGMDSLRAPTPGFWNVSPQSWHRAFAVNVLGPFHMVRHAIPVMLPRRYGRIVNLTTSLTTMIKPDFTPYGPLKAALESATAVWAGELDGSGITVNALLPGGPSRTRMIQDDPTFDLSAHRLLAPSIVVEPCLWLLSCEADEVTGARIDASRWPCKPVNIRALIEGAQASFQDLSRV
ncbi:MAG: SDR family NAD(P)-dependent oxidoreductase [Thermomicrobiales bacterium]